MYHPLTTEHLPLTIEARNAATDEMIWGVTFMEVPIEPIEFAFAGAPTIIVRLIDGEGAQSESGPYEVSSS